MKIVFLSHDGIYNGGAQMCLVDLIKGIKHQSPTTQLYIIVPKKSSVLDMCAPYIDGYQVIPMRWWMITRRHNTLIKRLKLSFRLKKSTNKVAAYLKLIKADLTLTNTMVVPQLAIAARRLGIAHIWFIHEIPMLSWPDRQFIYSDQKTVDMISKLSTTMLVTSEFSKRFYEENFGCRNIATIDQAVNIKNDANRIRQPQKRYTLMLVGGFQSNKGQIELLQAIKQITERGDDIYCYFVSSSDDNSYMDMCGHYIAKHHLDGYIEILPFTLDVTHYYNKVDVLVSCSQMESFGRVAVEAQLCGLPVILSDVGANSERVIDGVNGYVYQKGNVEELAQKIELLRDPVRRAEFSKNIALLHLEKHTPAAFADSFMQMVE